MQNDAEFYSRLAVATFGLWTIATLSLTVCRCFRAVSACVVAPVFLAAIWVPHRLLARGFFRSMTGVWNPTTVEIVSAAFTWALVATGLYLLFRWLALRLGYLPGEPKRRSWAVFRVMFMAHVILAFAIGCLGGDRAFGLLTVMDLQTYSLLIHARPGMGSGTFAFHSVIFFFPLIGGLTFAGYAVLVDGLGNYLLDVASRTKT